MGTVCSTKRRSVGQGTGMSSPQLEGTCTPPGPASSPGLTWGVAAAAALKGARAQIAAGCVQNQMGLLVL